MLRPLAALLATLSLLGCALLRAAEPPPHRALAGEIEGARWAALIPESWDGRLLLEAPDCRRAPDPLVAVLDPSAPATGTLLSAGWAVATTSYRRHGPIVADAIDDLRALRAHLAQELGPPKLALVEGSGMGGLIATLCSERHADEFHGCLALDPQLELRDPRALRLRCDHQPRAPLLFLATGATAEAVNQYIARARIAANAESIIPVFWFTPSDPTTGSSDRRADALAAMKHWAQTGQPPDERPMPAAPKTAAETGEEATPASEPAPETAVAAEAPLVAAPDVPRPSTPSAPTAAP